MSKGRVPAGRGNTHRCGPLPAAGAGPAYWVTATPSAVLAFSEEFDPSDGCQALDPGLCRKYRGKKKLHVPVRVTSLTSQWRVCPADSFVPTTSASAMTRVKLP